MQSSFLFFCSRHPALLSAAFFLFGLGFAKGFYLSLLGPLLLISIPIGRKNLKKLFPLFVLLFLGTLYGKIKEPSFPLTPSLIQGTALFIPSEIKSYTTHFKKTTHLKGMIKCMITEDGSLAKNIPCSLSLSKESPPIRSHYYIKGSLEKKESDGSFFSFKPDPDFPWVPASKTFSLAETRFNTKNFLSKKLKNLFSDVKVADFLIALSLGDLEDRMLRFDFGKLGLQHILAISGFHFGLLSLLLGCVFRLLLPEKCAYILLLITLTGYFLLLGNSPSILRAYLAISLYILSKLGRWHSSGLNILGAVLFIELLLDPTCISHLGFQLSFLATFAILLLLPKTTSWMTTLFPVRSNEESLTFNCIEKWIYLSCCFLRSTFALNLAVHLAVIPVCLFLFHKFPLISLAYNIFIPIAVSLSLMLLLLSLPFFFLFPPLGFFLTECNQFFTSRILQLISQSPSCFDLYIRLPNLPSPLLFLFLCALFSLPFLKKPNAKVLPFLKTETLPRL